MNFTPKWFVVSQASGIFAVILHQLDYHFRGLYILSTIVWVYTLVVFITSIALFSLKIWMHPKKTTSALKDLSETTQIAAITATLATIVDMICLQCVPSFGSGWGIFAYVLWWIQTFLAFLCIIIIPYLSMSIEPPGLDSVTPSLLMPVISVLTAAAAGGVLCQHGSISINLQIPVIIVSFLLVGISFPVLIAVNSAYIIRLFQGHRLSRKDLFQNFLMCGPSGQVAYAIQALGEAALSSFGTFSEGFFFQAQIGTILNAVCICLALICWGSGMFWVLYAIIILIEESFNTDEKKFESIPFTLTSWAVIFPTVGIKVYLYRL